MTHDDATRLFYELVWPHRAMVLRTAQFLARNFAEAEDLAQETLVKAFRSISQYDQATRADGAKAWLSTILRNTWIDHLRSAGRHDRPLSADDQEIDIPDTRPSENPPDSADPAALLEQFSDADMITALRTLPAEIRWTLLLVDVESLDHAQAAEILQVPEGTVKSRAHRGRRMLRERLLSASHKNPLETRS